MTTYLIIFFEYTWPIFIGFLSNELNELENKESIIKILDISITLIKLSDSLNLKDERNAFVNLLV